MPGSGWGVLRKRAVVSGVAMVILAGLINSNGGPLSAPISASLVSTSDPTTPMLGMQDGWIQRPGDQGCSGDADHYPTMSLANLPRYTTSIPPAMSDPAVTGLQTRNFRLTVPWDIAWHHDDTTKVPQANQVLTIEQQCMDYWLELIQADGDTAEVQFRPDVMRTNSDGTVTMPVLSEYRQAMSAFFREYACGGKYKKSCRVREAGVPPANGSSRMSRVSVTTPWGENDFMDGAVIEGTNRQWSDSSCTQGPLCGPVLAANSWLVVKKYCRGCTVIAGFSAKAGLGGSPSFLQTYARNLTGYRPEVWALDDYGDVAGYEKSCWVNATGHVPLTNDPSYPHNWHWTSPMCSPAADFNAQHSQLWRFSSALRQLGYRNHTQILMGEISSFYVSMFCQTGSNRKCMTYTDSTGKTQDVDPWFGFSVENQAAGFLMHKLANPAMAGTYTPAGSPYVSGLYYMRFSDGSGFPDWSPVLTNPGNAPATLDNASDVVAPHSTWIAPAYYAMKNAPHH